MTNGTFIIDSEATGLLDHTSIDYSVKPYVLKDSFHLHCTVCINYNTNEIVAFYDGKTIDFDGRPYTYEDEEFLYNLFNYRPIQYTHYQLKDFPQWVEENLDKIIGHNIINYDLLVYKLWYGMDYSIGYIKPDGNWFDRDKINAKEVEIEDTFVRSCLQNPDRFGGHSLDNIAKLSGHRGKFKYDGPWHTFNPIMLYYNIMDCEANKAGYDYLLKEAGQWAWEGPLQLEKAVAEIITRQEHYGFKYDRELGKRCYEDLSLKMQEIEEKIVPLLPNLPKHRIAQKDLPTFPAKPFKADGEFSSTGLKHLSLLGFEIIEEVIPPKTSRGKEKVIQTVGKEHTAIARKMLQEKRMPEIQIQMKLSHHIPLKEYIISLGWEPTVWKEKDLTLKSGTKIKCSPEEFFKAVQRYIDDTIGSGFEKDRCEHLKTTPSKLRDKLLNHDMARPLKVLSSPSYTIDQEKTIDPSLERLGDKVEWVGDLLKWLTYNHRKNSIFSPASETKKEDSGWLAHPRLDIDGRIPSAARTIGAVSRRMTHTGIANIPRVSSLYGEHMRAQFCVEDSRLEIGMDFDSLEARIQSHYTWKHDETKDYSKSLLAEKPNSVHCRNAKIMCVSRDVAKNSGYAMIYGCTIPKLQKMIGVSGHEATRIFNAFWEAAKPLADLKKALEQHWEKNNKKYIVGLDGAKLVCRSKHSLINTLFQSAGAICAKRALVWWDKAVRREGLDTNQLIAYHDEAQMDVVASDVVFKIFDSEEKAKEWKESYQGENKKILSDIGHKGDKWFVAYCRAGELASMSCKYASDYYKLNVPLSGGYQVGRNWAECH